MPAPHLKNVQFVIDEPGKPERLTPTGTIDLRDVSALVEVPMKSYSHALVGGSWIKVQLPDSQNHGELLKAWEAIRTRF